MIFTCSRCTVTETVQNRDAPDIRPEHPAFLILDIRPILNRTAGNQYRIYPIMINVFSIGQKIFSYIKTTNTHLYFMTSTKYLEVPSGYPRMSIRCIPSLHNRRIPISAIILDLEWEYRYRMFYFV